MRLLLMGQCTLHLGRLEYGNIGNYYIVEPLIRELHRVFPGSEIRTTFQMSDSFCLRENVVRLPLEIYYSWNDRDLSNALMEVGIARIFKETGKLLYRTPFIEEVLSADLIIDFSGDMWGDNADLAGENRFIVGLCKDYVPMLLGKDVVMLAGSPGPFGNEDFKSFAKKVYSGFRLVTTRERLSKALLEKEGFDLRNTFDLACPSFLFDATSESELRRLDEIRHIFENTKPVIGFFLCGWNFKQGPFDRWPRGDDEYEPFVKTIEFIIKTIGAKVCLASHSNGFQRTHNGFQLTHGRDYPIVKQLQRILENKGFAEHICVLDGIYLPHQMKAIIGKFSMVVSGRLHGAVASLSQCIPTVIIDYGHEPKAHKLRGFADLLNVDDFVADPSNTTDLVSKIGLCWEKREEIKIFLENKIPSVKELARKNFEILRELLNNNLNEASV